ncbi:hypothetical protein AGMMS49965_10100 [Bacteroidia bacterium]|nr:hypothetical protein AGMMS49965_10100 [Bacteroidia bacterium]
MKTGTQATYINPLTDFGFKKLFGTEHNKELLIDFLNEIIKEEGRITDINYLPTEQLGAEEEDRRAVFDIYCTNERGEHFIVEMQNAREPYFVERSLFYAAFPLRKQAERGNWKFDLKAVYFVGILNFDCFDGDDYIERAHLVRDKNGERFTDKLNFVYVILPKFKKTIEQLETNADRWLYCLKNMATLASRPVEVQGRVFEMLFRAAKINRLTQEDMETYNKSILDYADVRRCTDYARHEGLQEGLQQGMFAVAKRLNESGAAVEFIATVTGLTAEQIRSGIGAR